MPKPQQIRNVNMGIRVTPDEDERIRARVQARGISLTEYIVGACLGTLDVEPADTETRFEALEERIARLEDARS